MAIIRVNFETWQNLWKVLELSIQYAAEDLENGARHEAINHLHQAHSALRLIQEVDPRQYQEAAK